MKKFTLPLRMFLFLPFCLFLLAFSFEASLDEEAAYIQNVLKDHYDSNQEGNAIKRYELLVTNAGFCRYKRYFVNGKVEYFSLNLAKFRSIDYLGDDKRGKLLLHTKAQDVIVQTYKDRKNGDVDSMATFMALPLKDVEPEDLIDLQDRLTRMNALLMARQ